jgi:hypothetical protein
MAPKKTIQYIDEQTDIGSMQRDLDILVALVEKFDIAIERLTAVSTSVEKMLAVHETRLQSTERQTEVVHQRITDFKKDVIEEIKSLRVENDSQHKDVSDRLARIERWKWFVIGIASGVGFIASTLVQIKDLF